MVSDFCQNTITQPQLCFSLVLYSGESPCSWAITITNIHSIIINIINKTSDGIWLNRLCGWLILTHEWPTTPNLLAEDVHKLSSSIKINDFYFHLGSMHHVSPGYIHSQISVATTCTTQTVHNRSHSRYNIVQRYPKVEIRKWLLALDAPHAHRSCHWYNKVHSAMIPTTHQSKRLWS